jgi:mRNA-degrading endonuclease toxin of MazEF toxin-antitoxin module
VLRFPATVLVEPAAKNGLRFPSVALVFQLTAVDNRFITSKVGSVFDKILEEIFSALDTLTGRP